LKKYGEAKEKGKGRMTNSDLKLGFGGDVPKWNYGEEWR